MIPTGGPGLGVPAPGGLRPHLVVRLRTGWRFDEASSRFFLGEGEDAFEPSRLPEGSKIVYMIPDLQGADRNQMSEDDAKLASYLHILLPPDSRAEKIAPRVVEWPCVVDVRLPPELSLPMSEPIKGSC